MVNGFIFSNDYLFTFGKLQSYSKETDFSNIGMPHSDKVISIPQKRPMFHGKVIFKTTSVRMCLCSLNILKQ